MLKRCIFALLFIASFGSHTFAQVMKVNANDETGLNIALATNAGNYTLYRGDNPVWGNLGHGGFVEYILDANAGTYNVQLYYSNGTSNSGSVTATVNGSGAARVNIPATGSWGNFQLGPASTISLPSGRSTFRLTASAPVQTYNLAGILVQPVAAAAAAVIAPAPAPAPAPLAPATVSAPAPAPENPANVVSNRLFGSNFFVNPYDAAGQNAGQSCWNGQSISKIANQAQGVWFGDWNENPQSDASVVIQAAALTNSVPIMIAYNMVNRDCGGYSSGGAQNAHKYQQWIQSFAKGIGQSKAVVILEPDSLTQYNTGSCLNPAQKDERLSLMQFAISMFNQHAPNAMVYLDAGPPNGIDPNIMARTLNYAGVNNAAGFAVNVSNYETNDSNIAYGTQISNQTGGKHFVIDTSRNGAGPAWDHQFCNPSNRGLGVPSQGLSSGLVDAYLWVQNPGTSDGSCNGAPPAGQFSNYIACTLLQNSAF